MHLNKLFELKKIKLKEWIQYEVLNNQTNELICNELFKVMVKRYNIIWFLKLNNEFIISNLCIWIRNFSKLRI